MSADGSAYSALGLEPDADAAVIDRAYKRLIKQYHPDREGGDARRAAEINRAYRELRGPYAKDAVELYSDMERGPGRQSWKLVAGGAAVGLALGIALAGPMSPLLGRLWSVSASRLPLATGATAAAPSDSINQPLDTAAIDGAASEALRISRSQDEMALTRTSQECHDALRASPGVSLLDRCAAFDDAVVELQDRDPLRDKGPFSQLAVTGRQWSAASALSNDYLAIDSRLDRIRLRVELGLAAVAEAASSD